MTAWLAKAWAWAAPRLKKVRGYLAAFAGGVVLVLGAIAAAKLKPEEEKAREGRTDAETKRSEEIRSAPAGDAVDALPAEAQGRLADIERAAVEAGLERARDLNAHRN